MPNFEKQTMGHFFGVGVQITKEAGEPLKVTSPLVGTTTKPALSLSRFDTVASAASKPAYAGSVVWAGPVTTWHGCAKPGW